MPISTDPDFLKYAWSTPLDDAEMFELAPVALLLGDYSGLKRLFDQWRSEGVTDLQSYLNEDFSRVTLCYRNTRVLKVNREALQLFQTPDFSTLLATYGGKFQQESDSYYIARLVMLWEGQQTWEFSAQLIVSNGSLRDVRALGRFLPGHATSWGRVLTAIEDVTAQQQALRQRTESEDYARAVFDLSPVSLWVEDFSEIKRLLDEVRSSGVQDLRAHLAERPELGLRCMRAMKVVDVNQHTLTLFGAADKAALLGRLGDILRDDALPGFVNLLSALWNGERRYNEEVLRHTLDGRPLDGLLQLSIMANHEHDWGRVLLAFTDITDRKQAEARLAFLSRHDALTGLHNRAAHLEEIARLERDGPYPISVFIIDLDGLKAVNDADGHAAGDDLLRRTGRVLRQATDRPCSAARLGGDEFALLVPAVDEAEAAVIRARIEALLRQDNENEATVLRLSIGVATCRNAGCLEDATRQADLHMYDAKRAYYANVIRGDRRLN